MITRMDHHGKSPHNLEMDTLTRSKVDALNRLFLGAGGMAVFGAAEHVSGTPFIVPILAGTATSLSFILPSILRRVGEGESVTSNSGIKPTDRHRINRIDFALKAVTNTGGFVAGTFIPSEHWLLAATGAGIALAGYGLSQVNRSAATHASGKAQ